MKTNVQFILMLLVALGASRHLSAQKNLDYFREKCDLLGFTKKVIVSAPSKNSRVGIFTLVQITISDCKTIVDELKEAFEKDRPQAGTTTVKLNEDRSVLSQSLVFRGDTAQVTYSCIFKDDANADFIYKKGRVTDFYVKRIDSAPMVLKYVIPEGGHITVDGKKYTAEEARKQGYDVVIVPAVISKE